MNSTYPFPVFIVELINNFYMNVPIGDELDTALHESESFHDLW